MTSPLAIDGGTPVRTAPLPWPAPGAEEIAAVTEVLRSGKLNYWTGEQGRRFEAEYAESLGRTYAIALANGTLALELAVRAFGIGAGDEVVVPSRTFIGRERRRRRGRHAGLRRHRPRKLEPHGLDGRAALSDKTRAVIPVHLGGWPVDMDPLVALAAEHDLIVIEDCAQRTAAPIAGAP